MNDFAAQLLAWHDENARDLPWRGEDDPYRIWISEIMLQQTRAETVKGYYRRFLEAFPTVQALAQAPEARVLKLWEGLGYYSRARNLMKAAQKIVQEHGGRLPDTRAALLQLPGIGEYVSGAVASIAFGRREPALDGNQARVLSRIWDIAEMIRTPAQLYDRALAYVPEERPGDYNQALMGLGALLCTPKNPHCADCPVAHHCLSKANGTQEQRPVKPPKRDVGEIPVMVALVWDAEGILMRRRGDGLLAGLWEFPNAENARTRADLEAMLAENGVDAKYIGPLPEHKHVFSHRIWRMKGCRYRLKGLAGGGDIVRIGWNQLEELAIPTAFAPYTAIAKQIQTEV